MSKIHQFGRPGGPNPVVPGRFVLAVEARKARARLLPSTFFYPLQLVVAVALSLRSIPPLQAAVSVALGLSAWTLVEYLVHRYILHGRFPDGPGVRHVLHRQFDHLHLAHHARPWDGNHVNGTLKDTLGPSSAFMAFGFVVGMKSGLPVFFASLMLGYILEEWVHHAVHFCNLRNPYFRYIKRHHLFHHSPRGSEVGFGLTSGAWDFLVGTRIPRTDRERLCKSQLQSPGRLPPSSLLLRLADEQAPAQQFEEILVHRP